MSVGSLPEHVLETNLKVVQAHYGVLSLILLSRGLTLDLVFALLIILFFRYGRERFCLWLSFLGTRFVRHLALISGKGVKHTT